MVDALSCSEDQSPENALALPIATTGQAEDWKITPLQGFAKDPERGRAQETWVLRGLSFDEQDRPDRQP
jgi:hypothetical protein